jgi:hypothetical protein
MDECGNAQTQVEAAIHFVLQAGDVEKLAGALSSAHAEDLARELVNRDIARLLQAAGKRDIGGIAEALLTCDEEQLRVARQARRAARLAEGLERQDFKALTSSFRGRDMTRLRTAVEAGDTAAILAAILERGDGRPRAPEREAVEGLLEGLKHKGALTGLVTALKDVASSAPPAPNLRPAAADLLARLRSLGSSGVKNVIDAMLARYREKWNVILQEMLGSVKSTARYQFFTAGLRDLDEAVESLTCSVVASMFSQERRHGQLDWEFSSVEDFRALLVRIAFNKCKRRLRELTRAGPIPEDMEAESSGGDERSPAAQLQEELVRVLDACVTEAAADEIDATILKEVSKAGWYVLASPEALDPLVERIIEALEAKGLARGSRTVRDRLATLKRRLSTFLQRWMNDREL